MNERTKKQKATAEDALPSLPFSVTVTEETFDNLPDYMCERNPEKFMDYPFCPVKIEGEYWIIGKNGDAPPVYRFKGTNIENAVRPGRQPDASHLGSRRHVCRVHESKEMRLRP